MPQTSEPLQASLQKKARLDKSGFEPFDRGSRRPVDVAPVEAGRGERGARTATAAEDEEILH